MGGFPRTASFSGPLAAIDGLSTLHLHAIVKDSDLDKLARFKKLRILDLEHGMALPQQSWLRPLTRCRRWTAGR